MPTSEVTVSDFFVTYRGSGLGVFFMLGVDRDDPKCFLSALNNMKIGNDKTGVNNRGAHRTDAFHCDLRFGKCSLQ